MRRFELGLAPLLARLGYTRPDEDPLQSGDLVQPVFAVAPPSFGAPSPGSRVCWIGAGLTTAQAIAAGGFAIIVFDPPAGGCWLRSITAQTDGASYFGWATENQIGTGAIVPIGTTQRPLRFDNRETYPVMSNPTVGTVAAVPFNNRTPNMAFPPTWWVGTGLYVCCTTAAEGMTATLEFEMPLEGSRRQVV
jgi:hypothetical protein